MAKPVDTVELLAEEPSGDRAHVLSVLAASEAHRSWHAAREGKWVRYLETLPKDPSSPAKDTAGEVERQQKVGAGQAKRRTERAEQLAELPETEAAFEQGRLTEAHVDVLTRARAKADEQARAAIEANQNRLLDEARSRTPRQFQEHVDAFVKRHSADDGRSEWERKRGRRSLRLWQDNDGMTRLQGLLDPESGQLVRRTIGRLAEQLWRRDHQDRADQPVPLEARSDEARNADALVEACRRADRTDKVGGTPDRAIVVMSYETLLGDLDDAGISPVLADGTPLPAAEARRLACDAGIIPMVLDGDSVPLDQGRAKRDATAAQRGALAVQWSTCAIADCAVPFEWTQIHHWRWFNGPQQGPTDLQNLVPACDHGHRLAHTPGWSVEKLTDGSVVTTAPDGRRWHRTPNGPGVRRKDRPGEPPRAAANEPDPAATLFDNAA